MGKLEEIFTRKGSRVSGDTTSLDSILDQQDQELVRATKRLQVEKVKVEQEKSIAKDRAEMVGYENVLRQAGPSSVAPSTLNAMIKAFIDSGVDPEKTNAFFKGLDEEALARMAIISGGSRAESLMPLIFMAKQKGTTADELIRVGELFVDKAMKSQSPMGIKEVIEIVALVNAGKEAGSEQTGILLEEMKAQREQTQEVLEKMHEREIESERRFSDLQATTLNAQITEMRAEITQLGARDFATEIEKAKGTLEKLGLKVVTPSQAGEGDLDKANKLIGTVLNTPGVGGLLNAVGDGIRSRAMSAPASQPVAPKSSAGTVVCEVCMQKGVRTLLSLTPEVISGAASITCPNCGSTFRKPAKQ